MLDLRAANDEIGLTARFNCCDRAFGLRNTGRSRKSYPYYVSCCRFLTFEELTFCTIINKKLGDGNALDFISLGFGIFRSQLNSIARSNSTIYYYKIKYL